jgi:hypothetical protein
MQSEIKVGQRFKFNLLSDSPSPERQAVVTRVLSNREEGLGPEVDYYLAYWVEACELPETEVLTTLVFERLSHPFANCAKGWATRLLPALLLSELQKQHRNVVAQDSQLAAQSRQLSDLKAQLAETWWFAGADCRDARSNSATGSTPAEQIRRHSGSGCHPAARALGLPLSRGVFS